MDLLKILVLNTNDESLLDVLAVANTLHNKSGPFACALILGDVKKCSDALTNFQMELPTYIGNGSELSDGNISHSRDLNENLTVLNGFGFIKLANGLKIGYLAETSKLSDSARAEVLKNFQELSEQTSADILLSYDWSEAISERENLILGNSLVDQVASLMKPKYHFTGKNEKQFFELDPFVWDHTNEHICRFINVAQFKSGSKWAYAFKINLLEGLETIPDNLIDNPYLEKPSGKRDLVPDPETDNSSAVSKKQRKPKQVLPSECRFCLSNTKLNDHMIISISKFSYITIAKGPLTTPGNDMDFSGHCLIIPIEHIPKLNTAKQEAVITDTDLFKDLNKFEESIAEMNFKRYDMSTLIFEINSSNAIHFHKQLIPVPKYLIGNFISALNRQVHMNNEKFKSNAKLEFKEFEGFDDKEYLGLVNDHETNYFQFIIRETASSKPKVYISVFDKDERIDLQFGRRVAAFLLKQPKRTMWDSKVCFQTKQQEEKDVSNFQRAYKNFDFTLK
ncbi:Drn1p [Kluyveromyces lactis]|uniref:KLLA0D14927p n=1 Tax=Kluyveromyces lactis (strain ATCC 8585 / CBS 2359 / DSM 70799 / NBRC 1267 / NRRL Y-1140 / WM37) TaxID=284590 RepID=Q6CQR7_KLULA|nr:uncharacterized protein KLLA0_D14927g [Kluyveromyces lactis]CAH00818.1 KLLA0D14927p [Kluyveromyces lactis]|eukprot:XP_453722.1 uncharacterized protein KLLA0_D14927g [Kluyveromyces lactis]